MPLLSVTTDAAVPPAERTPVFEELAETYATIMDADTSYLAVSYRAAEAGSLWLGRADPDEPILFLEADVRAGRSVDRRREFALAAMDGLHDAWGVPPANQKVVFTEHAGAHMMGYDRVGGDWSSEDAED